MHIFAPIQKIEDDNDGSIRVFGVASAPVRDAHGEIVTTEAMQGAISDYMKFPAVREMHDATKSAGKGLEIFVDDDGISRFIAYIVDPIAVKKVKTGVYPGFSIGGRVRKRNPQDHSIIQEIDLMEISLVDRPSCPVATLDLWKRKDMTNPDLSKAGDVGESDTGVWVDKDKWDDGFDFFGEGGDAGTSDGPSSVTDGGPYRSQTPVERPDSGRNTQTNYANPEKWNDGREFFGQGGDSGRASMTTDANAGQVRVTGTPNATVNTAQERSDVGGQRTGDSTTGSGPSSSASDYFTTTPGSTNDFRRVLEMLADMYASSNRPPIEGADIMKRQFTVEQRRKAASSGAAMKDGSYPIENRGDLANAIRAFGRSKNPEATKAHIKRRAAALGATSMLPDAWGGKGKSAESEAGLNVEDRNSINHLARKPTNIDHLDGDKDELATKTSKTEDLLNTTMAQIERLEVKHRHGNATPESYRLAKAYLAMSEDELAEVLANDALAKMASNYSKVSEAEALVKKFKDENDTLYAELAKTNEGLAKLSARVQKLADQPMPNRTAGSKHVSDDPVRKTFTEDDVLKAKVAYEALSEEERVLLLTKNALAHPRKMNLDTVAAPPRSIGGTAGGREEVR